MTGKTRALAAVMGASPPLEHTMQHAYEAWVCIMRDGGGRMQHIHAVCRKQRAASGVPEAGLGSGLGSHSQEAKRGSTP